jgi:hypothetical protein
MTSSKSNIMLKIVLSRLGLHDLHVGEEAVVKSGEKINNNGGYKCFHFDKFGFFLIIR